MSVRILESVLPRQSPSSLILASIRTEADLLFSGTFFFIVCLVVLDSRGCRAVSLYRSPRPASEAAAAARARRPAPGARRGVKSSERRPRDRRSTRRVGG